MSIRPTLRKKLLFFSVLLALLPLGIAGRTMITITQDELKSAANDEIAHTAGELAAGIDELCLNTWLAPLRMVRDAVADGDLAGLSTPARDIVDLVWIELRFEGLEPIRGPREDFAARLEEVGLDPYETLEITAEEQARLERHGEVRIGGPVFLPAADVWLLTLALPLEHPADGRPGTLAARFDLDRLRRSLAGHPFNRTGSVRLVDARGRQLFDPALPDRTELDLVRRAVEVLRSSAGGGGAGSRTTQVAPYVRPSGEAMLGGYAFPLALDWAVVVERTEDDAYLAVAVMRRQLLLWVSLGVLVATAGAVVFSRQISRPIVEVGRVAQEVGRGNLKIRVRELSTRDEVADLARRINEMIRGLHERFELAKFVSGSTVRAIAATEDALRPGGTRKTATVLFSDIRGFTAFSEKVEPSLVVEMLNTYLRCQAETVLAHHGDVDKFVGDEVVAVFQGEDMVRDAARCAIEIHRRVAQLNDEPPRWSIAVGIGINTGDMIMGAVGSADRMDYTVLGDSVNLGARLCSAAAPRQTIVSESSRRYLEGCPELALTELEPVRLKGKSEPVRIYDLKGRAEEPAP